MIKKAGIAIAAAVIVTGSIGFIYRYSVQNMDFTQPYTTEAHNIENNTGNESKEQTAGNEEVYTEYRMGSVPELPRRETTLERMIPEGWKILDSQKIDFDQDGSIDYIGVLERADEGNIWYPRILFAARNTGADKYILEFQDASLVRAHDEGGILGDPYQPLLAKGQTFTVQAYGGSAWRWYEANTFERKQDGWYLSKKEKTFGYGDSITEYARDDYDTGVGDRKYNNPGFDNIESQTPGEFQLEFSVPLDAAPTLDQFSRSSWTALDRITDFPVQGIAVAEGISLPVEQVQMPEAGYGSSRIAYMDEENVLYIFEGENGRLYLAKYSWASQEVLVLEESSDEKGDRSAEFMSPIIYHDKIYYAQRQMTNYPDSNAGSGVIDKQECMAVRLYVMEADGSNKHAIFEYTNSHEDGADLEALLPYLSLSYEIVGGELITAVQKGENSSRYFRMNTDGQNLTELGGI